MRAMVAGLLVGLPLNRDFMSTRPNKRWLASSAPLRLFKTLTESQHYARLARRCANRGHYRRGRIPSRPLRRTPSREARAGYRSARPITSNYKSSHLACNARPVHTEVPTPDITPSPEQVRPAKNRDGKM